MKNNEILQSDILDIVFEGRNKMYGAYELRINYHKRAKRALAVCVILAGVFITIPLLANIFADEEKNTKLVICNYPLSTLPKTEVKNEVKKNKETKQVEDVKTIKNTTPEITITETVNDDDKMPTKDELKDAVSGVNTNENGENTNPVGDDIGEKKVNSEDGTIVNDNIEEAESTPLVFVEVYPEFPGGDDAMFKYIQSRLNYPRLAVENSIEGKVVVEFVVNEKGEIHNTRIVRGLKYGCDDEALRVINGMPLWKPGKQNGKPVAVFYTLPIQFTLADK